MKSLLVCLLVCFSAAATAARPPAIDDYLRALSAVETARAPVSLEPLFAAADEVQAAVMQLEEGQAWLETLSDADYQALGVELRGFLLSRGYDIYAQPLPDFLLALAQTHGQAADVAFFTLYRQYWGVDFVPVFQRQGPFPTPCIRYNEGVLPEFYEAWRTFMARHPGAYADFAGLAVKDVEEMMTLGTCACGDQRSVEQELRKFLKRFPQTPVASLVQARLQQLREDPDKLPIHCR